MNAHFGTSNKAIKKALAHQEAGRLKDAERLFRSVLQSEPHHPAANHGLGMLSFKQGMVEAAIPFLNAAVNADPQKHRYWFSLAEAFIEIGALAAAQFVLEKGNVFGLSGPPLAALTARLKHWELGLQNYEADRLAEAERIFTEILSNDPAHANSLHMLGAIAIRKKQYEIAVDKIREAIRLKGAVSAFHGDLGNALDNLGRFDEAIMAFNEALRLDPDNFDAHNNIGNTLINSGKVDAARPHFERALAMRPDDPLANFNMGNFCRTRDNHKGIEYYKKALRLDPMLVPAHSNLIFTLVYADGFPPTELVNRARDFDVRCAAPVLRERKFANVVDPDRRLRIGFVSADFRKHAVSYFCEQLFVHLDRRELEIFAYSNHSVEDAVTERLKASVDHWRHILPLDDDAAADLIEADSIDILVDLSGHTGGNRLLVFARKPAPVQVTWLGFSTTTGMRAMDYRITDVYAEPPGMTEHLNVETLWRLPRIFCCYQGSENGPAVIDHPPKDDNGYVTFGCFNNYAKLTDPVLALWARIMARLPDARLMLEIAGLESAKFRVEVEERLARFGLPLDRLILVPRDEDNQYVLYNKIDIALDPFPSNGGTTSMDTLWMGVPFVTLAGDRFSSRMGGTILTNAGLPELVAADEDQYVEIAVALATDDARLRSVRHNLRERVEKSPLMDQASFARDMADAYRGMWKIWCAHEELFKPALQHYEADRLAEAERGFTKILSDDPTHAESIHMLGVLAIRKRQYEVAVDKIREAIRLKGTVATFHSNLGNALDSLGRFDEAIKACKEALRFDPDSCDAHNNIGNALLNSGKMDEARPHFERALAMRPDHPFTNFNMGNFFRRGDSIHKGIEYYKKAIRLDPAFFPAYSNLIFTLVYADGFSPTELVDRAREFDARFAAPLLRERKFSNVADPDRRLRIGFVSADFRKHAVSYFCEQLFVHLDRRELEIFAYSNHSVEDAVTARLKASVNRWRNILFLDDDAAADLIEADGIDILVDLSSHTLGNRLLVFARKPAPIQVTWLGFSATTGMRAIDYRITDVYAEPPGMTEDLNVETLWRLPRIFCCYQGSENGPTVIDHPPKDDHRYVTFGCFNNFSKVTDPVLALWARIMALVPDARLMLEIAGLESATFRAEVEARLTGFGLPLDRLILVPRSPANQFVLYNKIDIALDPFPSNGGTTSMDTMWMGVPFVTLSGSRFSSRMGVTILTNAGLSELVAADEDQYVELAVALATDDARLRAVRHNLRKRVEKSPLMDQTLFARDMADAYRGMWKIWCAQQNEKASLVPGLDEARNLTAQSESIKL